MTLYILDQVIEELVILMLYSCVFFRNPFLPINIAFKVLVIPYKSLLGVWKIYNKTKKLINRDNGEKEESTYKWYIEDEKKRAAGDMKSDEGVDSSYMILGIDRSATRPQIRRAYIEKMNSNHPDKVAQLDIELQRFALERTKRIQQAYAKVYKNTN